MSHDPSTADTVNTTDVKITRLKIFGQVCQGPYFTVQARTRHMTWPAASPHSTDGPSLPPMEPEPNTHTFELITRNMNHGGI